MDGDGGAFLEVRDIRKSFRVGGQTLHVLGGVDFELEEGEILLGKASLLAAQPEFTSGERMKGLIELTEQRDVLIRAFSDRDHQGGLNITIGQENVQEELTDFTLVTSEYHVGGLKGVIGIIGPTRMPYEKVIAIVDSTSSLVNRLLGS